MAKGGSTPTRFDPLEEQVLADLAARTGLSKSEIIRRCVRLMRREVKNRGGSIGFILELLGPLKPDAGPRGPVALLAEDEPDRPFRTKPSVSKKGV